MPQIRSGGYSSFNLNHFPARCALYDLIIVISQQLKIDQISTCLVPHISGIKLQLECDVRIEPA